MTLLLPSWLHRAVAVAALFSLGACGLPQGGSRTASTAIRGDDTRLAAMVRPKVAAHPGQSGLHALPDAHDAFAARLALADAAQRSLDVQYYIWSKDLVGKVLLEHLIRAADRGVRVRMLLDDLATAPSDSVLLAIDSHPNIEVRMFNPVKLRSMRLLGIVADLGRINRRMHNKSFTADGQVAIVGGRNIGEEYFGAHAAGNFADLDLAVIGPAVKEVSAEFDLYWKHKTAVPIANLSRQDTTPEQYAARRAGLRAYLGEAAQSEYANAVRNSEFPRQLRNRAVTFSWGRATIVNDNPDKVLSSPSKEETHLAPELREVAEQTRRELILVSPYFVPGKRGVELLTGVRRRGARVVILTNSLASTDGVPVHSRYKNYRKPLLEAGVELYEMKPKPTGGSGRAWGTGFFGEGGEGASSGASLHAKTFSFDRRIGFVGSYNLDPRSSRLNTEMGVLIDCPELTRGTAETLGRNLGHDAYRVELDRNRLVWVTREDGQQVRYTSEPQAPLMKRIKSTVFGWLPIEGLL